MLRASLKWTYILWVIDTKIIHVYNSMFHACEMPRMWNATPRMLHGILHVESIFYTLRETWSTQTQAMNSISLCRVSFCVHACSFEVITERYCMFHHEYNVKLYAILLKAVKIGKNLANCLLFAKFAGFYCWHFLPYDTQFHTNIQTVQYIRTYASVHAKFTWSSYY